MDDTPNLVLPLVQASQAQKHVTVNEALVRLDAVAQLVLAARDVAVPPVGAAPGGCYAVPVGATGDWAGQDGRVAVADNGGWSFLDPRAGWRAWDAAAGAALVHDGADWRLSGLAVAPSGAGARFRTVEAEHEVVPGPDNVTAVEVPAGVTLFAVGARVTEALTGTAATWRLGQAGATDRFGAGLGLGLGSFGEGILGQPQGYYAPTPLVITGEGGALAGGRMRFALHYVSYDLPGA